MRNFETFSNRRSHCVRVDANPPPPAVFFRFRNRISSFVAGRDARPFYYSFGMPPFAHEFRAVDAQPTRRCSIMNLWTWRILRLGINHAHGGLILKCHDSNSNGSSLPSTSPALTMMCKFQPFNLENNSSWRNCISHQKKNGETHP